MCLCDFELNLFTSFVLMHIYCRFLRKRNTEVLCAFEGNTLVKRRAQSNWQKGTMNAVALRCIIGLVHCH